MDPQEYQHEYEYSGSFILYEGVAWPGAAQSDLKWLIKKYSNDGTNITGIRVANGTSVFDKSWTKRTEYSY